MSLGRTLEENQVSSEVRRIYADIRTSFDLPFVPTIFKVLAARPEYLRAMWTDLSHVARAREFHSAAQAVEEYARSLVISPGWRFGDQQKILAAQKFSLDDMEALSLLPGVFTRSLAQMALFARLMQRGYAGGQRGRVSEGRQASAMARLVTLNVPSDGDAGLRVWLLYSDIKKTTGLKTVLSLFRILSPYPGYLAATWMDCKKLLRAPEFLHAAEQMGKRISGLLIGLPVKDHRSARGLASDQWEEIEELVDRSARLFPQFALLATVWQRSFAQTSFHERPAPAKTAV